MLWIGIDEAGMGTLAGPMTAAVVVIDSEKVPPGVRDSKALGDESREELAAKIMDVADYYKVVTRTADKIDEVGISKCWLESIRELAFAARLMCLPEKPIMILDGNRLVGLSYVKPVVKADATHLSVGAASILAKYTQCCWMDDYHLEYPSYGFNRHRGYPTPEHAAAIRAHGAVRGLHRVKHVRTVARNRAFSLLWR